MPHHEKVALTGKIHDVFAHRFTLEADGQIYLADVGPKGAELFPLTAGLAVKIEGERRPSEIKVMRIAKKGGRYLEVEHKKPHHGPKKPFPRQEPAGTADQDVAVAAATSAGWALSGEVQRKPKHFEVLARKGRGEWTELHIDFSGTIYKEKVASSDKWNTAR